VRGIENGFFQRESAEAAFQQQRAIEKGERTIVGVNDYRIEEPPYTDILRIDEEGEKRQLRELAELRRTRDAAKAKAALRHLTEACEKERSGERPNMMLFLLEASRAYCTLGEIREAMVAVHGEYREPAVF